MDPWKVTRSTGTATTFLNRDIPASPRPEVWIHQLSQPALVLGSAQKMDIVNLDVADELGVEVCQRRSGGGIVGVQPDDLWVDILLPRTSPLWDNDVGRSMDWVGQSWARALQDVFADTQAHVHTGRLLNRELGKIVCFAGLGPGEVTCFDHKVIGISQRRTRTHARFQCLAKYRWSPEMVQPLLRQPDAIPWPSLRIGLPPFVDANPTIMAELESRFLAQIPLV